MTIPYSNVGCGCLSGDGTSTNRDFCSAQFDSVQAYRPGCRSPHAIGITSVTSPLEFFLQLGPYDNWSVL
jgi:hypothetical protein